MKLRDVLEQVNRLQSDDVIFARKPWTLDAEAEIGNLDNNLRVPDSTKERGLEYFLEASAVQEVLEVFGNRKPTPEQVSALLLFYAESDAYPKWVYEFK